MSRRVLVRAGAHRDIEHAVRYLRDEAGTAAAERLVDAFAHATRVLSEQPGIGTPRFATELRLPGLRALPVRGFPYLTFYLFDDTSVEIWRVLHTRRDIPSSFHPSSSHHGDEE